MQHIYVKANLEPLLSNKPEAYYWAGFLGADGCFDHRLGRLIVGLGAKDVDHLSKLAQFVEYEGHCHPTRLSIQDKYYVPQFIARWGIKPNKTYNPPDQFPQGLELAYYFAGFVDGDGNIRKGKGRRTAQIRIKLHSSWLDVLQMFSDKLYELYNMTGQPIARINTQGYAEISFGQHPFLKSLKRTIEDGNLPLLERKWKYIDPCLISKSEKANKDTDEIIRLYVEEGWKQVAIATALGLGAGRVSKAISKWRENQCQAGDIEVRNTGLRGSL